MMQQETTPPTFESWIGVDFDATLSHYEGWSGHEFERMGPPIPAMMERIKAWRAAGQEVRIFTARAAIPEQIPAVRRWLETHGLGMLEITNVKDRHMFQLWDDRAVQVEPNTGRPIVHAYQEAARTFGRAWAAWHNNGEEMPSNELITAAVDLLTVHGLTMAEGDDGYYMADVAVVQP